MTEPRTPPRTPLKASSNPQRIISLLPSATEILFDLGLADRVVGITFECDFPAEARSKRIVSTSALPEGLTPAQIDAVVSERMAAGEDLYRLDEGAFAALQPDLVITQDLCAVCAVDTADVTEALSYLGCSADVVSLDPMTLDDVLSTVRIVGEATGTVDQASKLTDDLRRRLAAVDERLAGVAIEQRPTTLVLEWTDPAFTGGHWVPEMVERAGGAPVLGFAGTHSRAVPWSDIAGSGAEVTIVAPCGYRLDGASSLAEETVRSGQLPEATSVWAMDADAHVVRPGPRVVDGIEILAAILHPELCGAPLGVHARRISPAG